MGHDLMFISNIDEKPNNSLKGRHNFFKTLGMIKERKKMFRYKYHLGIKMTFFELDQLELNYTF